MYSKTIDNVDRTTDLLNLHCDLNLSNFLVAVTLLVLRRTDLSILFLKTTFLQGFIYSFSSGEECRYVR